MSNFKAGGTYAIGSEVFLSQIDVADLFSTFGTGTGTTGWRSSATSWAVVGTSGVGSNTLWATQTIVEVPGSSQSYGAGVITTMYAGLNGRTSTANSNFASVVPTTSTGSWKTQSSGNFSYFMNSNFRNNSVLAVAGPASIGFYEYVELAASTQQLGTFKLYSNGNFSFTAAIPEPTTYAAILGVAVFAFAALRRRMQALVA